MLILRLPRITRGFIVAEVGVARHTVAVAGLVATVVVVTAVVAMVVADLGATVAVATAVAMVVAMVAVMPRRGLRFGTVVVVAPREFPILQVTLCLRNGI